jgi:predicted MFS family arabinose efflux permease
VTGLSEPSTSAKVSVLDIFRPQLLPTTLLITAAYFAHITSFYFIIKWTPKVVVNLGFEPAMAAGVLAMANIGGATGGAIFGLLALRFGLKSVTGVMLLGAFATILWFGFSTHTLISMKVQVLCAGFFANAAIAGLYLLFAKVLPTHVRATGTGFAIGAGRGGAAMAPVLAGYLFQSGYGLGWVAAILGSGSLIASVCLYLLREHQSD